MSEDGNFSNQCSNGTASACEPCNDKNLYCLIHAELTDVAQNRVYKWEGANGELAECDFRIYGLSSVDGKNIKGMDVKFSIVESEACRNPNKKHDKCTTFYYYEADHLGNIIGKIEEKGKDSAFELKFNEEYFVTGTKKIPFYIEVDENDKVIDIHHKPGTLVGAHNDTGEEKQNSAVVPVISDEKKDEPKYEHTPLHKISDLNAYIEPFGWTVERLASFVSRVIWFSFASRPVGMPSSKFHLGALDCKFSEAMPLKTNDWRSYHDFDRAMAEIFVLPQYAARTKIRIKFPELKKILQPKAFINGIEFYLDLEETFNEQLTNKFSVNLTDLYSLVKTGVNAVREGAILAPLMSALPFSLIFGLLPYIDKLENFIPRPISSDRPEPDPIIGFAGEGFKFETEKGKSVLIKKDGKLEVQRENVDGKIVSNVEVYLNLLMLLIKAVPPVETVYKAAQGVLTSLSYVGVDAHMATDRNYEKNLEAKRKEEEEGDGNTAWAAATLIIYADLAFMIEFTNEFTIPSNIFRVIPDTKWEKSLLEFKPSFNAGASFKVQIFIFKGAAKADFSLYTGLRVGFKKSKTLDGVGAYLMFLGMGIKWETNGSIGLDSTVSPTSDEDDGIVSARTTQKVQNSGIDINKPRENTGIISFDDFIARDRRLEEINNIQKNLESELHILRQKPRSGIIFVTFDDPKVETRIQEISIEMATLYKEKNSLLNMSKDSGTTKLLGAKILNMWNLSTEDLVPEQEEIDQINRAIV